jgi:hypothetical protein
MGMAKTSQPKPVAKPIVTFFLSTVGLVAAAAAIGYVPTVRLGGDDAMLGLIAGCAVSLFGSWIGSIPIFMAIKAGRGAVEAALGSMALRFVLVGGAAVTVALLEVVPKAPFLIWVATSYVVLLIADVTLALRCSKQILTKTNKGGTGINDAGIE